jgi:hypothetical protein
MILFVTLKETYTDIFFYEGIFPVMPMLDLPRIYIVEIHSTI